MKKISLVASIMIVLGAGLAWAIREPNVDVGNSMVPQWFLKGFYVGSESVAPNSDTLNKVARMPGCIINFDFPSVTKGYTSCTPNRTCDDVKQGDPCFVGVVAATPADGGSAFFPGTVPVAIARADNAIQICVSSLSEDAGSVDLPDAGYRVRCISHQP